MKTLQSLFLALAAAAFLSGCCTTAKKACPCAACGGSGAAKSCPCASCPAK